MALVASVLQTGFANIPTNTDAADAAAKFAAVYQLYAVAAQAGPLTFIPTTLEQGRFAAALEVAFSVPNGSPAAAATAFVNAVTTFWMTPPAGFGVPPAAATGAVTAFAGGPALLLALEGIFASINDTNTFAQELATALDTATKTVVVLVPPSTPTNVS